MGEVAKCLGAWGLAYRTYVRSVPHADRKGRPGDIMASDTNALRRQLRQAGLTARAIDAVWPEWWSAEAEGSLSATTELRYTLARRLGLSPRSLFDGPPQFVWKDEAKFKNLAGATEQEAAVLASFGVAVGRCALGATRAHGELRGTITAADLRSSILASSPLVDLTGLLAFCWGVGIPVLQLALFPLARKRMHAITVRVNHRYAVFIGRESRFPAQVAYILAHEIGHIVLQHVAESAVLLEAEDPLRMQAKDAEEQTADRFALELLTGDPDLRVEADNEHFTATQLAYAASEASRERRIDPGVLALCLGHSTGRWRQGFGAQKLLPGGERDVAQFLNSLAREQLDWPALSFESQDYLRKVIGDASEP